MFLIDIQIFLSSNETMYDRERKDKGKKADICQTDRVIDWGAMTFGLIFLLRSQGQHL